MPSDEPDMQMGRLDQMYDIALEPLVLTEPIVSPGPAEPTAPVQSKRSANGYTKCLQTGVFIFAASARLPREAMSAPLPEKSIVESADGEQSVRQGYR